MRLSKIYSNKKEIFHPIKFNKGLNVIVAEIRLPENRKKDTHNLGKTTLGRLIDFCFLSTNDSEFFLFKNIEKFEDFIFFLEIELNDGSFLTIRRGVKKSTKISFKKSDTDKQDFSQLPNSKWDHVDLPFKRAKDMLDSLLDWDALKPWPYRKGLGYQLRSQEDYNDVFQLHRFLAAHSDWKPFLAKILGFNSDIVKEFYEKEDEIKTKQEEINLAKSELGNSTSDINKNEGILFLKRKEEEKISKQLEVFNFHEADLSLNKSLIDELDEQIAMLNAKLYSYKLNKKKIISSLNDQQIIFNPNDAKIIFEQAGIYFQGQIEKDFKQLIEFNQEITDERRGYLREELDELEIKLNMIEKDLAQLEEKRSTILSFLKETDIFNKYKIASNNLVNLRADIVTLERQKSRLQHLQGLIKSERKIQEELKDLQTKIEEDVEIKNREGTIYSSIRLYFSEIVEEVIDRKALLNVTVNRSGHLEFSAQILDQTGNTTSADHGHTYRKLLCIAFDLALLRGHLEEKFPRFVYHDGVFESLDDRKKRNLIEVFRDYSKMGIQSIITLIDSDIPIQRDEGKFFDTEEIIMVLHDEGDQGRLFKMESW